MGTLFPDDPEYPDYRPIPSVVLASIQLGIPLLLCAVLIQAAAIPPAVQLHPPDDDLRKALDWLSGPVLVPQAPRVDWDEDAPHSEQETGDPTLRGTRPLIDISTIAPPTPFFGMVDSSDVVRWKHRVLRDAHWSAINSTSSFAPPMTLRFPGSRST